jgi:hypothetical protein
MFADDADGGRRIRRPRLPRNPGVSMNRLARAAVTVSFMSLFAFVAAPSAPLSAQELATGTWSGTITPPDGGPAAVTFEVSSEGDDLSIMIMGPDGQSTSLNDVQMMGEALHFTIDFGVLVTCHLDPQDEGGFGGECTGSDGQTGTLTMVPPEDG